MANFHACQNVGGVITLPATPSPTPPFRIRIENGMSELYFLPDSDQILYLENEWFSSTQTLILGIHGIARNKKIYRVLILRQLPRPS